MVVDTDKLKVSTKGILGALCAGGALLQIPVVHDALIAAASDHPHVLTLLGTAFAIAGILHNPEVADALGIKRTVTVKEEEVAIAPEVKQ